MLQVLPAEDIVLFQSGDADRYFDMLRATAGLNRAFCRHRQIHYSVFHGVLRGWHPWQACFNRILVLDRLVELGFRGWFLHLDADAYVADPHFDIRAYLAGLGEETSFVFAAGAGAEPWDVNDGVFLANCAHADTVKVARLWREALEGLSLERLRAAPDWYGQGLPGDQALLHRVLRSDPALTAQIWREPASFLNGARGRFTRQVMRSAERDLAQRVDRILLDVERCRAEAGLPLEDDIALYCALARRAGLRLPRDAAEIRALMQDPAQLELLLRRCAKRLRDQMAAPRPEAAGPDAGPDAKPSGA